MPRSSSSAISPQLFAPPMYFLAVFALPVIHPLVHDPVQAFVDPQLLSRRRVERDEGGGVAAQSVQNAIDIHGAEARRGVRIEPRHLELSDVRLGDLIEAPEVR